MRSSRMAISGGVRDRRENRAVRTVRCGALIALVAAIACGVPATTDARDGVETTVDSIDGVIHVRNSGEVNRTES